MAGRVILWLLGVGSVAVANGSLDDLLGLVDYRGHD